MSFSSDIKEELCKIKLRQNGQKLAVLAGLTQTCSTLRIGRTPQVLYQSELSSVTHLVEVTACQLYELDAVTGIKEQEHRLFPLSVVRINGTDCRKLLMDTGILSEDEEGFSLHKNVPENITANEETRRCFLRGVFLGSGSCSDPSGSYHLELGMRTEEFAGEVAELIRQDGINAKVSNRKGRYLVYVKSDDVTAFLAQIGASSAALKVEDVRAVKDYRNYINRTSNCETANIDKTVRAALQQVRAIECLEKHMNLNDLPGPLYEAARLRLQNPDASLQELADLAEIGKSGMNHRLTRIIEMAQNIEGEI